MKKFERRIILKSLQVEPNWIQKLRTGLELHHILLKKTRLSNVVPSKQNSKLRCLLIKDDASDEDIAQAIKLLKAQDCPHLDIEEHELVIGYEQLKAEEALKFILPENVIPPTSFETIGHVAHFNLREEHEPYKHIIGKIVLDKNPNLLTIVNKVGTLKNEFRTFTMEVIAGKDDTNVKIKERDLKFEFDFRKVYWNTRLCGERERLLQCIQEDDVLIDAFAGIGALATMAAKERKISAVYANDLNPNGATYIQENFKRNHVDITHRVNNLDAREYLRALFAERPWGECKGTIHIIMNLPELALDFCDVYQELEIHDTVRIHCHCFAKAQPPEEEILPRLWKAIGKTIDHVSDDVENTEPTDTSMIKPQRLANNNVHTLEAKDISIVTVRDVAPNKMMYCVECTLPRSDERSNSEGKRRKVE